MKMENYVNMNITPERAVNQIWECLRTGTGAIVV